IIANFRRDRDLVALGWERFGDQFLAQSIAISVGSIEQVDTEIEGFVHESDRFALGEIAPPTSGDRPHAEADLAHRQIGVLVSPEFHGVISLANPTENVQRRTLNTQCRYANLALT